MVIGTRNLYYLPNTPGAWAMIHYLNRNAIRLEDWPV